MATNPSTLPENSGRIIAPNADYSYGSAKNDSTGSTGDGTPIQQALMNDSYGLQQALLRASGIIPSGNEETQLASQYLQAIIEQAMGRASFVVEDVTSVADAYEIIPAPGNQAPAGIFDGMVLRLRVAATNVTTTPTIDAFGTVVPIRDRNGSALFPGQISQTDINVLMYDASLSRFLLIYPSPARNALIYNKVSQTIPDASWARLNFDTVRHDSGGMVSGNNGLVTPINASMIRLSSAVGFSGVSTAGIRGLKILNSNGTPLTPTAQTMENALTTISIGQQLMVSTGAYPVGGAGQIFQVYVYQNSGAPLDVYNDVTGYDQWFSMEVIE